MKKLALAPAEKIGAKQVHKTQIEDALLAPDSPGPVREPMLRARLL